jgi:hypothetical protein
MRGEVGAERTQRTKRLRQNMLAMASKQIYYYRGARTLQSLGEGEQPLLQRQGWVGSGRHIVDVVAALCSIWRGERVICEARR